MQTKTYTRRSFIRQGLALAAATPLASLCARSQVRPAQTTLQSQRSAARVAIASCRAYGPEVRLALEQCFDLLGGIGALVRNKTVTVKLNLTGNTAAPLLGRPVGETYVTHYATLMALGSLLFGAGARRVRLVESIPARNELQFSLVNYGWDLRALAALGKLEFENTRNLGQGKKSSRLSVPSRAYMFSAFRTEPRLRGYRRICLVGQAQESHHGRCDALAQEPLRPAPNSLYGIDAGNEDATAPASPCTLPGATRASGCPD